MRLREDTVIDCAVAVEYERKAHAPPPHGAAKVPSPLKKVVVLLGGVGTAPHTVADITGRSELTAAVIAPVPFPFTIPVRVVAPVPQLATETGTEIDDF